MTAGQPHPHRRPDPPPQIAVSTALEFWLWHRFRELLGPAWRLARWSWSCDHARRAILMSCLSCSLTWPGSRSSGCSRRAGRSVSRPAHGAWRRRARRVGRLPGGFIAGMSGGWPIPRWPARRP
jgi:hypothetical protein